MLPCLLTLFPSWTPHPLKPTVSYPTPGIIGTGATSVQAIPHLGEWAKQLYVFQRTPSSIDIRGNGPTDPEWAKNLKPGWQALVSTCHRCTDIARAPTNLLRL